MPYISIHILPVQLILQFKSIKLINEAWKYLWWGVNHVGSLLKVDFWNVVCPAVLLFGALAQIKNMQNATYFNIF